MRVAVVAFPGSNCDRDCVHALGLLGMEAELVWHRCESLRGFDAVVLPGGFSYGDYLRPGALARFSPVMAEVRDDLAAIERKARRLDRDRGARDSRKSSMASLLPIHIGSSWRTP